MWRNLRSSNNVLISASIERLGVLLFQCDVNRYAPSQLLLLHENELHKTFPNVCLALRMYLSLIITNCSGERSFSKMAIKNEMRATMSDPRLSAIS